MCQSNSPCENSPKNSKGHNILSGNGPVQLLPCFFPKHKETICLKISHLLGFTPLGVGVEALRKRQRWISAPQYHSI